MPGSSAESLALAGFALGPLRIRRDPERDASGPDPFAHAASALLGRSSIATVLHVLAANLSSSNLDSPVTSHFVAIGRGVGPTCAARRAITAASALHLDLVSADPNLALVALEGDELRSLARLLQSASGFALDRGADDDAPAFHPTTRSRLEPTCRALARQTGPSAFVARFEFHPELANEARRAHRVALEQRSGRIAPHEHGPVNRAVEALSRRAAELELGVVGVRHFVLGEHAERLIGTASVALGSSSPTDERPVLYAPVVPSHVAAGIVVTDPVFEPSRLVTSRELICAFRCPEAPSDEGVPLRTTRARRFGITTTDEHGTSLGYADGVRGTTSARLSEAERLRHAYVVGQTGTGKSNLLAHMIVDDIERGHGVTVLDPHGELVADVLARVPASRVDDVVWIDLGDTTCSVPMNPLHLPMLPEVEYQIERDAILEDMLDVFDALYDLRATGGPMFEKYFRLFVTLVLGPRRPSDYAPSLALLERVFDDEALARRLARRFVQSHPHVERELEAVISVGGEATLRNMTPYVTSKVSRFLSSVTARRVLAADGCLDFDAAVRDRRIILVRTASEHVGSATSALICRQVVGRLVKACMRRGPRTGPTHYLYADEFQHFATERFVQVVSESRKFGLGAVLSHQYLDQLVARDGRAPVLDAVLGNVGTIVCFRVGTNDARRLAPAFAPRVEAEDLASLPNYQAIVRRGALGSAPFTLDTFAPVPSCAERGARVRALSVAAHGVRGTKLDREIAHAFRALGRSGDVEDENDDEHAERLDAERIAAMRRRRRVPVDDSEDVIVDRDVLEGDREAG